MSTTNTAKISIDLDSPDVSASGYWGEYSKKRAYEISGLRLLGHTLIAAYLFVTPITAPTNGDDELLRSEEMTMTWTQKQEKIGRPVSRADALNIAKSILETAEKERLEIAAIEATRGVQWGENE